MEIETVPTITASYIKDRPMQGQFKTVGGKLVVVDFDIEQGRLRNVVIHGDFFVYPEDAFPALAAALEGAPSTLSEAEIAARLAAAIPPRAEVIGTSPEAIATAIHRGIAAHESETARD
jgi:lipoate---protein ligase